MSDHITHDIDNNIFFGSNDISDDIASQSRYEVKLNVTGGSATVSSTRPKAGDQVTVTILPDKGMQLDSIQAVTAKNDTVVLTKKSENQYTFRQPRADVTVSVVCKAAGIETGFTDVSSTDWFAGAVDYVVKNGLMNGIGNGLFAPQTQTDRAMVVTILYRMEKEPVVTGGEQFPDVAPGTWYTEAVRWATAQGIVEGYGNGSFGPADSVTREQLAVILYRYAQYKGYDMSGKGDLSAFSDGDRTSAWAAEAMQWAVGTGVLSGKGGSLLDPTGTASRAEVAQLLMNFCQNREKL